MNMQQYNSTNVFTFIDFTGSSLLKTLVATGFLLAYTWTIVENLVLIIVVYVDRSLHTPMYFFLGNFSFIECCLTTSVIPKTFHNLVSDNRNVPIQSCVPQMYSLTAFGSVECALLGSMAYDRYVVICHPLHYSLLMSRRLGFILVYSLWFTGLLCPVVPSYFVSQLHFCSQKLNHFFCDFPPVLQVACSNISNAKLSLSFIASGILLCSLAVVVTSYSRIVWTILHMHSRKGVQKTISTCVSHLTVACIYYFSGVYVYVRPNAYESEASNKYVALLYAVVTPLLNPLIYSLRNKDVLIAIRRVFSTQQNISVRFT